MPDCRRLLIIKPSSLGDIIHALPVVSALRRRFPSAGLTWLVKREWAEVLEGNPDIDEVMAVDLSLRGWPEVIQRIRAGGFDLVVDLQGLLRSAILARVSGAPVRVGFANGREGSPWFYTDRVPVPAGDMHAVDRYLLVSRFLGAPQKAPDLSDFPLPADPAADDRVAALLASEHVRSGTILVAMNPTARWDTKQWPSGSFLATADRLQAGDARVVLIGSVEDSAVGAQAIREMRTPPIDLMGKTTLKELIAVLRRARVLVTNDSGPMHLAAAVGTPVVALFGPTDPARTGPYGPGHTALRSGVPCSPCFSRRCTNVTRLECLTAISPDEVIRQVLMLVQDQAMLNIRHS
jgi:lipopolysaccharide heptosyltransferase I